MWMDTKELYYLGIKLTLNQNRLKQDWEISNEFIFFFTKNKHNYFFDADSIRIPYKQKNPNEVKSPRHHDIKGKFQRHTPQYSKM